MKKRGNPYSIEWQIKKYGISEEEAKEKIKQLKKKVSESNVYSIEWQIQKYNISEEEAKNKIQKIKDKIKLKQKKLSDFDYKAMSSKNPEHWIKKGYSAKEAAKKAKKQIFDMQQIYQEKKKNNPEKYIGSFNTQIEYHLKQTNGNLDKAKELLIERQSTNNLKTYIKKYGDSGYDRWKERNKEWSILMEKKYKKGEYSKAPKDISYISSKIEREFISKLLLKLPKDIKYKTQFRLYEGSKYYMYDVLINNKVIIEFNGDFWHANPKYYDKDWINPLINESAKTIWNREHIKLELIKEYNYDYIIIWENEYRENKNKTIDILIQKLYDKNYI